MFLIAICHQSGDKWQSKTLFLTIYYLPSSIVSTFRLPDGVLTMMGPTGLRMYETIWIVCTKILQLPVYIPNSFLVSSQ